MQIPIILFEMLFCLILVHPPAKSAVEFVERSLCKSVFEAHPFSSADQSKGVFSPSAEIFVQGKNDPILLENRQFPRLILAGVSVNEKFLSQTFVREAIDQKHER